MVVGSSRPLVTAKGDAKKRRERSIEQFVVFGEPGSHETAEGGARQTDDQKHYVECGRTNDFRMPDISKFMEKQDGEKPEEQTKKDRRSDVNYGAGQHAFDG